MSRWRAFLHAQRATAAIEFAILCPPLLLLLFGICETGRLMWIRQGLAQVAITGARCMGVGQQSCTDGSGTFSSANTTSFIQSKAASWGLTLTTANITLANLVTCGGQSGFSQVTLTYGFSTAVQSLIPAYSGPLNLTASACFPNAAP